MRQLIRRAALLSCVLLVLGLGVTGCSRGSRLSLDENTARDSLKTALESWKKGDTQKALKDRSPSIIMGDDSWEAGKRLVRFKVQEPGVSDGVNLHCKVELVLADKDGGESRQTITYIVGTSPVITIFPK
jgi:hypothetical protein